MAKFIPVEQMAKLREASRSGDERAKKILSMQLSGTEDFSSLLDEYFKPQVEEAPTGATSTDGEEQDEGLIKFLEFNKITKDSPDYDSYVEDYYKENPKSVKDKDIDDHDNHGDHEEHCVLDDLIADEIEAISGYNTAIMTIMSKDEMGDSERKGIISSLEEIKKDEVDHLDKLKRMKSDMHKKEERTIEENL